MNTIDSDNQSSRHILTDDTKHEIISKLLHTLSEREFLLDRDAILVIYNNFLSIYTNDFRHSYARIKSIMISVCEKYKNPTILEDNLKILLEQNEFQNNKVLHKS